MNGRLLVIAMAVFVTVVVAMSAYGLYVALPYLDGSNWVILSSMFMFAAALICALVVVWRRALK